MCGLVAAISKGNLGFSFQEAKVFKQLLYIDALRGFDSVGVFHVNDLGSVDVAKSTDTVMEFLGKKTVDEIMLASIREGRFLVGHNRSATKGAVNEMNAHPFTSKHITLVHNGTLYGHKKLADAEVDSEAIAKSIAEKGYKHTLSQIDGAFALIWYDMKEEKLFVCRNSQRPLHIAKTSQDTYFIASEAGMLDWVLTRNNVNFKEILVINEETKENKGTVFSFELDNPVLDSEEVDFLVPAPITQGWYSGKGYYSGYGTMGGAYDDDYYDDQVSFNVTPITGPIVKQDLIKETLPDSLLHDSQFWSKNLYSRITFTVDDYVPSTTEGSFKGKGFFNSVPVEFYSDNEDDIKKLFEYEKAEASLDGFPSFLAGTCIRIFVKNVVPILEEISRNGEVIDADIWESGKDAEAGGVFCDSCSEEVLVEDIHDTVIRVSADGKIRRVVCGKCCLQKEIGYAN